MSCPDWGPLVAHRFTPRGRAPEGWRAALDHLAGCAACRRAALALDPTLVFVGLAGSAAAPAADEVADMRSAVRRMRRAHALEGSLEARGGRRAGLAAAALAVAALALPFWAYDGDRGGPPEAVGPGSSAESVFSRGAVPTALPSAPLVEALDRPQARVYEFGQDDDLSLVMIVDENLDV